MSLLATLLKEQIVPRIRKGDSGYNAAGKWVEGTEVQENIQGIIEPFQKSDQQFILPDGIVQNDARKLWTTEPMRTATDLGRHNADIILIDGVRYEAQAIAPWNNFTTLINQHYECLLIREDKAEAITP